MTVKSNLPGIGQSDFQLQDYSLNPEISEEINQAIAYLSGYYSPAQIFKAVQTDVNGRLLISNSNVGVSTVNQFQISIPSSETTILAANPNRQNMLIYHIGSAFFNLAFATGVALTNPIYFHPGDILTWDGYVGPVYGFGGAGASVVVVEY